MFDQIEPAGLGQADHGGFAGTVNAHQGLASSARLRGHVDDLAALPLGHHGASHGLQGEKHAFGIHRELFVEAGFGDLQHGRHVEDRGVVDQNVDTAKALGDLAHHGVDGRLVAYVQHHAHHPFGVGILLERDERFVDGSGIDVGHRDAGSFQKIAPSDGQPYPRAPPVITARLSRSFIVIVSLQVELPLIDQGMQPTHV